MKMMKITRSPKHNGQRYYAGEVRMLSDEDAALFAKNGWACAPEETPAEQSTEIPPVTLQVQSARHANKARL